MSQFTRLGKYHVLERLAASRLAEIYKVKTVGIAGFEKVQVLNRILPRYSNDPSFLRAFIAEAKVAFSLNHRNIVQVFEFGKADGELFLATEYIPGVNLETILAEARRQGRSIPIGLACYLMAEMAAGLEYAHRKTDQSGQPLHIAHGELAPHNVACSWEGSVKVLDFGISRAAWAAAAPPDRYRDLPLYFSPEQVRDEPLHSLGDIYSFGVVLWEILTGHPLVSGNTAEEVTAAIASTKIESARDHNREVPVELDALTLRCLQRDPDRRFDSASRLQVELHRIQRQLGSVIGSRSLATFLHELFPERNESRDVRQESPRSRPYTSQRESRHGERPQPLPDLVDAAAELAAPRNPPAEAAPLQRGGQRDKATTSRDAHAAGVLRSVRDPDESPRVPSGDADLEEYTEVSSPHVLPGSLLDHPSNADGPLDHYDETTTRRGNQPLVSPEADPDTMPELSPIRRVLSDRALRKLEPITADDVHTDLEDSSEPVGLPTNAAAVLREKKRFIAVALRLDGPTDSLGDALRLVQDIAFKHDGIVHAEDPHGAVVLFGLPLADENDTVVAVRFSLDVMEALARYNPGPRVEGPDRPLSVQVGIRAGSARMRASGDSGYQVMGNSIADTRELSEYAGEGLIYLAGAAARLASMHYTLHEVKTVRRRGKPVRCYKLVGQLAKQRKHDERDPFVGREMELRSLRNTWRDAVLTPQQRTVLIIGDAGLGKSRLVDEFLLRHASNAAVVTAAATPHRRYTPYAVVLDMLRGITGVSGTSSARSRKRMTDRLATMLEHVPNSERHGLLDTINALIDPNLPATETIQDARVRKLHYALRGILSGMAVVEPLIVVVEDLHWADNASIGCLRSLAQRPDSSAVPLLLALTSRPLEADAAAWPDGVISRIFIEELDAGDRQQLINEVLAERATPTLAAEIERRARGNPFYIHELAAAASEMDVKALSDIPHSVRGVLAARIDQLGAQIKVVLQHAAVIGPTFREGVLTQLLAQNPARSLAELRNRGILLSGAAHSDANTGASEQFERQWAFRHVLMQEVIYDSLSSSDRKDLHAKVADITSRRATSGSADSAAEVAAHLEAAGRRAEAAPYYLQAAQAATAAYANGEALRLFDRTLAMEPSDDTLRFEALAGRERIYGRLGQHDRQGADLLSLRPLCLKDPSRRADLRAREALRLLRVGEFYQALEAAEQAGQAAREAKDPLLQGEALRLLGEAYHRLDDYARALESVEKALTIFRRQNAPAHEIRAHIAVGAILLAQARYEEALEHYDPALELIRDTENRWLERVLRNNLAVVNLCRGHYSRALEEASASFKLCSEFGDLAREGDNLTVIGIIYRELGLWEAARRQLNNALSVHRTTGSRWSEADTMVYAGLLHTPLGQHDTAIELLCNAKAMAQQLGAKSIEVNARNSLALALLERKGAKDRSWAYEEAKTASEMARGAGLTTGEIPGLSRAARARAQMDDMEAARALSRRAIELLSSQRTIDSPEEEIYYTHYRVLSALSDDASLDFLRRAHAEILAKSAHIEDPVHRERFQTVVPLNVAIRRDFARYASEVVASRP